MNYIKANILPLLIVVYLIVGAVLFPNVKTETVYVDKPLGAANNATSTITNPFNFQQGFQVSPTGDSGATLVRKVIATQCNIIGANVSQAASSSAAYDCAVTGVTSTDFVIAQLASSTVVSGGNYFSVTSAKASTTAGFATLVLWNNGTASSPAARGVGSSTPILIIR